MAQPAQAAAPAPSASVPTRMVGALLWRARREGLRSVFLLPGIVAALAMFGLLMGIIDPGGLHGTLSSPSITGGGALGFMAALTTLMAGFLAVSFGASNCVQSAVGSEAVNGSFELMLGTGITPRNIWHGLVRVLILAVVAIWVIVGVALAIIVTLIMSLAHIQLSATPAFWVLLVFGPLALGLAGAILALGVGLAYPALFEPTRNGLVHTGGGGIAMLLAVLPAIACTLVFACGFTALGAAGIGTICAVVVLACVGIGCWFGLTQFSQEQVISSV